MTALAELPKDVAAPLDVGAAVTASGTETVTAQKPPFNLEALRKKYAEERDKRLKYGRGLDQYCSVDEKFNTHLLADPFSPRLDRAPLTDRHCEVLVIGGGYGAQLVAVELQKAGITDFLMVEKGGDFGGTWYWNRYPGAQCDIESYVYMPLLDESGYIPTRKYAFGTELFAYAQLLGRTYDLYRRALFQTEVQSLHWSDRTSLWTATTDRHDTITARFVIPVAGPLHRPKLPNLPGLSSFAGHAFHTSRWDFAYTGGDAARSPTDLHRLSDKVVGVIGTGATAVQIVPHLGAHAKHLYVFQRTPSGVDVRGDRETDAAWVAAQKPGWQRARMENFNRVVNGAAEEEDLVADGWTDSLRKLTLRGMSEDAKGLSPVQQMQRRALVDMEKMESVRGRVDEVVRDRETAEKLKPWYNQFCKRPCFHDGYLPTFNRDNVTLVHTDGRGVEGITPGGVLVDGGKEIKLDCLIWATGFDLASSWTDRSGIDVRGRGGLSLKEKWADGPVTLHGHSTRDFPNLFFVHNTQAALSPNFLHVTGFQAKHISYIIRECQTKGVKTIEPTTEAEEAWVKTIIESRQRTKFFRWQCTPGYYNNEGESSPALDKRGSYGGGPIEFMEMMDRWREAGKLEGLELR